MKSFKQFQRDILDLPEGKTERSYYRPFENFLKSYLDGVTTFAEVGGYQPLDKWLKDRKKANRVLSTDDKEHYMKIAVSLRETQKIMQKIDALIPDWAAFNK